MRTFCWFLGLLLAGFAAMALLSYPAWLLLHPHANITMLSNGRRLRHIIALRLAQASGHLRWDMDRQEMAYGAVLFIVAAAVLWDSYRLAGIIGLCIFYTLAALFCAMRLKAAIFDRVKPTFIASLKSA